MEVTEAISCLNSQPPIRRHHHAHFSDQEKNFMPLFFKDGVQLPQGYSHFEEAVIFTIQFPEIPGTHFIDLRRMKG